MKDKLGFCIVFPSDATLDFKLMLCLSLKAAFGHLHNDWSGAFGDRPIVVESIIVDGKAADIRIQASPTFKEGHDFQ